MANSNIDSMYNQMYGEWPEAISPFDQNAFMQPMERDRLTDLQEQVLHTIQSGRRHTIFTAGRRSGKTWLCRYLLETNPRVTVVIPDYHHSRDYRDLIDRYPQRVIPARDARSNMRGLRLDTVIYDEYEPSEDSRRIEEISRQFIGLTSVRQDMSEQTGPPTATSVREEYDRDRSEIEHRRMIDELLRRADLMEDVEKESEWDD